MGDGNPQAERIVDHTTPFKVVYHPHVVMYQWRSNHVAGPPVSNSGFTLLGLSEAGCAQPKLGDSPSASKVGGTNPVDWENNQGLGRYQGLERS